MGIPICKNLMIAGIKPELSKKLVWDFLMAISPIMSAHDKDGVGYAAMGREGVWGERWLRPVDAWKYRKLWTAEDEKAKGAYKGTLEAEPRFNEFGGVDPEQSSAIILHARMATCEKSIVNTHPFVRDGIALIHNGVINNTTELENLYSTCDSETILNSYVKHDVKNNPDNISKVADEIRGYYACGVLSEGADGKRHLDVFRSSNASLSAYYVKELDAVVFCTRSEMIREACKALKWSYGNTFTFKDDVMIRIDCDTGQPISTHKFFARQTYYNSHGYNGGWKGKSGESQTTSTTTQTGGTDTTENSEKKSTELKIVKGLSQEVIEEARTEKRMSTLLQTETGQTFGRNATEDKAIKEKMKDPFYYQAEYANYLQ